MQMSSSSASPLKSYTLYLHNCSCPLNVDGGDQKKPKTKKKKPTKASRKCLRFVGSAQTAVALLFLFCFCPFSVDPA